MNSIDVLKSKMPVDYVNQLGGSLAYEIISAMREYAKLKCLEQRVLCSEHATGIYKDYPPSKESIINSPEPNFD